MNPKPQAARAGIGLRVEFFLFRTGSIQPTTRQDATHGARLQIYG